MWQSGNTEGVLTVGGVSAIKSHVWYLEASRRPAMWFIHVHRYELPSSRRVLVKHLPPGGEMEREEKKGEREGKLLTTVNDWRFSQLLLTHTQLHV